MSLPDFKTQIANIRKEALDIGFATSTIDGYFIIWNRFIIWKNEDVFIYSSDEYDKFLLEHYNFDVSTYTNKSKSRHQQLMRSKRIIDDFDTYKQFMVNKMFSKNLFSDYPSNWNNTIDKFLTYSKDIRLNCDNSLKLYERYLKRELSYFYQKDMKELSDFSNLFINQYISDTINAGDISKRRNFHVLRKFLNYLFIEDIINEDLSLYVPKIKQKNRRKRIPSYLKGSEVESLLESIPKETKTNKRDYAIILIAARLGLRISDILNIKLKDIDWQNYKLNVIQPKTKNLNTLPLTKEVGWAIIDYIKIRPKCDNEYLFVKSRYPFEKMEQFNTFNKYFDKTNIEINEENKKGIHNLRNSLAKNMLDNDIPIQTISSTLGHSNTNLTFNSYTKIDIKNLKKCTMEVDE